MEFELVRDSCYRAGSCENSDAEYRYCDGLAILFRILVQEGSSDMLTRKKNRDYKIRKKMMMTMHLRSASLILVSISEVVGMLISLYCLR